MRYYLAPLEGITGYIFCNAHTRLFTPADKYFSPFLVPKPNSGKQFSAKEKADILPEHNQNIHLVPQIMTNKAADFIAMTKALEWLSGSQFKSGLSVQNGCHQRQRSRVSFRS